MFWGITLENGKRYSQTVEAGFHVSMAALEFNAQAQTKKNVPVMIEHNKSEFLLCTLQHATNMQQNLDLNFVEGEEVTFFLNGQGTVHLTGYLLDTNEDEFGSEPSDSEFEMTDAESEENDEKNNLKRKLTTENKKKVKKAKLIQFKEFEDDDEDDEEDEESDENLIAKMEKPKKKKNEKKQVENEAKTSPNKASTNGPQTPTGDGTGKKKRKKKKKKNKGENEPKTPTTDTQNTPKTPNESMKKGDATPKKVGENEKSLQNPRKVAGGTSVEDVTVGNGPLAKRGRFVQIAYVGRLSNNKVFDSSPKDTPLGFKIGSGEVIKGLDLGIEGMKVGGKRKLVIPPHQGYGKQSSGPIPANSTLQFEIELKSVK